MTENTPTLIAFGNVLLDCSFLIENDVDILSRFQLETNGLGECSTDKLADIQREASKT